MAIYGYYVNCDERGEFRADVRAQDDTTLYEVMSDEDGEIVEIEGGFMSDPYDVSGLYDMLRQNGVLSEDDKMLPATEAEELWAQTANHDSAPADHDAFDDATLLHKQGSHQPSI